jgi:3-sulfinopropanoyl-CoA desulfinase
VTQTARAKIFASKMAIKVTQDSPRCFGARFLVVAGYSGNRPLEPMPRDASVFTIGRGTARVWRTVLASRLLGGKAPWLRDGYGDRTMME